MGLRGSEFKKDTTAPSLEKGGRTLWSLFKEAREQGLEARAAARFVLRHASQAALLGLLAGEFRNFCRRFTREVEQEADAPVTLLAHPGDSSPAAYEDRLAWAARLAPESFQLHDGATVFWGEATPAQHRERAAFLEQQAQGTLAAAQRHRFVADEIEQSHCRNLNEMLKKKGGRR